MPAFLLLAILLVIVGLWFAYAAQRYTSRNVDTQQQRVRWSGFIGMPLAITFLLAMLALVVAPTLTQWLYVSPNEITVEKPYITHNIEFTRHAFGLDEIEKRDFTVAEELDSADLTQQDELLNDVRLWDPRALADTYEQFQEIRLYYEFTDVDIDRYRIGDEYRQVMVSPREIEIENLPSQSQTFVNRRFKYTHGYGITLAPVSDFTPEGLPNLLVKDLPPKTTSPDLTVNRPEIYYGEQTRTHAIVNTSAKEFDYPSGEENVYTHYGGDGGVLLNNIWRRLLFGWKFDGTRFFVSGYPTADSNLFVSFRSKFLQNSMSSFVTAILILARHQITINGGVGCEEVTPSMLGLIDRPSFAQFSLGVLGGNGDAKGIDLTVGHPGDTAAFHQDFPIQTFGADQTQSAVANGS